MTQLEALKEIAKRDGGLLRPAAVVDAARDDKSPLHGAFEWDDTEAAQKYRLLQAQSLIRSFKVEIERNGQTQTVPVFVGVSTDRTGEKSENPYRLLEQVVERPDLMAVAVRDALDQLEALRKRYAHLQDLADVWMAVDKHTKRCKV